MANANFNLMVSRMCVSKFSEMQDEAYLRNISALAVVCSIIHCLEVSCEVHVDQIMSTSRVIYLHTID